MEESPDGLGFRRIISAATAKACTVFKPNLHEGPWKLFLKIKYFSLTLSVHKSGLGGIRRHRRCLARQNHGFVKRYENRWRKMGWGLSGRPSPVPDPVGLRHPPQHIQPFLLSTKGRIEHMLELLLEGPCERVIPVESHRCEGNGGSLLHSKQLQLANKVCWLACSQVIIPRREQVGFLPLNRTSSPRSQTPQTILRLDMVPMSKTARQVQKKKKERRVCRPAKHNVCLSRMAA